MRPGVIGTTAALYHIGAAPLAGLGRQVDIPSADRVREVPTVDLLNIARLFFSTRRFEPADQLITLVLDREDEHREAALRLAITIRFDIGRDQDVLRHCDELIAMDPNNPEFYRVQMMVHRNHGRWDNFIPAAEKAVQLTPGTDWVLMIELADGYTHLGRSQPARLIVDQLKQHRPDLLERAPVMHARLLMQEGQNAEATEIIDDLLRNSPEDPEALLMKGKMLVAEEKFAAAVETFETLLAAAPAEEQAYYQLGQAHARLGNADQAREYLHKHRQLLDAKVRLYKLEQQAAAEPFNQDVRRELVESYKEIGLNELSDFWRALCQSGPGRGSGTMSRRLAIALLLLGIVIGAVLWLRQTTPQRLAKDRPRVSASDRLSANDHFRRGAALAEQGRLTAAYESLQSAVEAQPSESTYRLRLAMLLYVAGDYPQAHRHWSYLLQHGGLDLISFPLLGNRELRWGYEDRALDAGFIANPRDPLVLQALGHRAFQQKDFESSENRLRAALRIEPDLQESRVRLAQLLFEAGRSKELVEWLRTMDTATLDHPQIWMLRGHLCRQAADSVSRRALLRRSLSERPLRSCDQRKSQPGDVRRGPQTRSGVAGRAKRSVEEV